MGFGTGDLGMGISFTLQDNFSNNSEKIRSGMLGLTDTVDKLGAKSFIFNEINQAVTNLTGVLSQFTDEYVSLDKEVKNIGTLGVENFEEFAQLATKLSKEVPDSAAKIAQGVYDSISAGISGTNQEIIDFTAVASKAAVAGMSDTQSAVNGLTSVMNAYKMETSQAGTVADTFFGAIKLGKTTFNEMNRALANVIPAASAAGIQFDEVAGSIAQMTALGVPTAMASTQIRQAIIELQKPGKDLEKAMNAAGLSVENIGDTLREQGLLKTLQQVQEGSASLGKSLTQSFSSSEAASAALLLTGENAERANKTLAGVRAEIAANAASKAFDVAAESMDVKYRIFLNKVQAGFNWFFDQIGQGAVMGLQAFNQFAPTITALLPLFSLLQMAQKAVAASQLWTTITTKGLSVGLKGLAVSAWSALAPLLPLIAAVAAVVAIGWAGYEAIASFKEVMAGGEAESGFMGWLQKIGGVVMGLVEIWQSWDGETWQLSASMQQALEKIGILDFVLNVGTWLVRLKTLMSSVWDSLYEGFQFARGMFNQIMEAVSPITGVFDSFSFSVDGTSSSLEIWSTVGRALGKVIKFLLLPLFGLVTMAVVSMKLAFGALTWVLRGLIGIVSWVADVFMDMYTTVAWIITDLFSNAGMGIVDAIKQGLLAGWDGLVALLLGLIKELPFAGEIMDLFGIGGEANLQVQGAQMNAQPSAIGQQMAVNYAAQNNNPAVVFDKSTTKTEQVNVNLQIGEEQVKRVVNLANEEEDARS